MNGDAFNLRGSCVHQYVLCPDAGVVKLSLMAVQEDELIVVVEAEEPPERLANLRKWRVLDAGGTCGAKETIILLGVRHHARRVRPEQHALVVPRRFPCGVARSAVERGCGRT